MHRHITFGTTGGGHVRCRQQARALIDNWAAWCVVNGCNRDISPTIPRSLQTSALSLTQVREGLQRSLRRWARVGGRGRSQRTPKQNAGFHLHWVTVLPIRLEPPLSQSIADDSCLIRKRAEEVNVFHLALPVDDDADGNRIESVLGLGEDRINPRNHIFVACVILDADRGRASACPCRRVGLGG